MEQLRRSFCILGLAIALSSPLLGWADVQPGDTVTKANIAQAEEFLTPSTRWMVEQGMPMQVIATKPVRWPEAYRKATEQHASQVKLASEGRELVDYVAGCPFPQIDPNDPLAGHKVSFCPRLIGGNWNHIALQQSTTRLSADVQPGDTVTKANIAQAEEFLTPSTRWMVERGCRCKSLATKPVRWPDGDGRRRSNMPRK